MELKDHILNLNKIHSMMKKKPVRYRLYNFFKGVPDMLDVKQLKELRNLASTEHDKLIVALDKKIEEQSKIKKAKRA